MPDSPILFEIVVVFGAALAVIALSHRLRIPAVVGFLLAGILIGPYGTRRVFGKLRLPRQLIRTAASYLHEDHYAALLSSRSRTGLSKTLLRVAAAGAAENFFLAPGHWACGRSIRELDLRRATGATILAVLRDEEVLSHPKSDLVLQDDDTLVLVGDHASLDVALHQLEKSVAGSSAGVPAALLQDPPAEPGSNGVDQLMTESRRIA